jgi:hypothetical protein
MSGFEEHIQLYLYNINKMNNKQYHTVGTVPKSNRKIAESGKIDTP